MPSEARPFDHLLRAIDVLDIPQARLAGKPDDQECGLAFVTLALRLEHISRVTENLRLINTDHLSRTINVDVDLRRIPEDVLAAVTVRHNGSMLGVGDGKRVPSVWLPISRHSREDLAPVVVRNSAGDVVPRLTQSAANSAVIAGVTWLFRRHLENHLSAAQSSGVFSRKAFWLIEAAIAHLIEHGVHGPRSSHGVGERTVDPGTTRHTTRDSEEIRQLARSFVTTLAEADGAEHLDELVVAVSREYMLIVMVPTDSSHTFLTYDAPLIPAVKFLTARRRAWRSLLPISTEFTVCYVTQLPRGVGSYHVTIDVPEEIDVRRFILTSDADLPAINGLARRMSELQVQSGGGADTVGDRHLAEVEACLGLVDQRRLLDVQEFEYYLRNRELRSRRGRRRQRLTTSRQTTTAIGRTYSDTKSDQTVQAALQHTAQRLRDGQWGIDVSVDNDPRENGAHAQWKPVALGFGADTLEPIQAKVYVAMADEPPALVESVARMVGALALVVIGIAFIAAKSVGAAAKSVGAAANSVGAADPSTAVQIQADALVAVLLIVPGIMLSQLDIPSTHSVLGRLRRFPRLIAFSAVVVTTALAMDVAAGSKMTFAPMSAGLAGRLSTWLVKEGLWGPFGVAAAFMVLFLFACWIEIGARFVRRSVLVPSSGVVPGWLRTEFPASALRRFLLRLRQRLAPRWSLPDVFFDAIRPVPMTSRHATRREEDLVVHWPRHRPDAEVLTDGPALIAESGRAAMRSTDRMLAATTAFGRINRSPAVDADVVEFTLGNRLAQIVVREAHPTKSSVASSLVARCNAAPGTPASLLIPVRQQLSFGLRFEAASYLLDTRSSGVIPTTDLVAEVLDLAESHGLRPSRVQCPAPEVTIARTDRVRPGLHRHGLLQLSVEAPEGEEARLLSMERELAGRSQSRGWAFWRASRHPGAGQGTWESITGPAAVVDETKTALSVPEDRALGSQFRVVKVVAPGAEAWTSHSSKGQNDSGLAAAWREVSSTQPHVVHLQAVVVRGFAVVYALVRSDKSKASALPDMSATSCESPDYPSPYRVFWVQWHTTSSIDDRTLRTTLLESCRRRLPHSRPAIDEWVSAVTSSGRRRGRAVVTILTMPEGKETPADLGPLARHIQGDVITQLVRSGSETSRVRALLAASTPGHVPRYDVSFFVYSYEPWLRPWTQDDGS